MDMVVEDWSSFFSKEIGKGSNLRGRSRILVDGYMAFIKHCADLGVPPIFENTHLRLLLGLDAAHFGALLTEHPGRYRKFTIPKRSGGERVISSPNPALLHVQKWILRQILDNAEVSDFAHGGIEGRSIVTNAREHLGAEALLKLDIADFYGSVGFGFGISTFQRFGYPRNVALSLTQFCFDGGSLPQGAATSASLANLSCRLLDRRCHGLAKKYNLTYSRYFDDISFSGSFINERLVEIVSEIAMESGFELNKRKTRLLLGKSTKYVTGISVGGDRLRLPKKTRRAIRNSAYLLTKTGDVQGFAESAKDPLIIETVLGQVAFWRHVEPEDDVAEELFQALVELRRETDVPVELPAPWRPSPIPELDLEKVSD
ncbi:hypothetical protein CHH26_06240 [Qipengyuania flava]|uniref:reverse transcriptase family protein n=1 Tax=Qipengyuania flava TaxID=192812 RepID=UPI000B8C0D0A|nr:reverse transcriptase family protein [Qipengyuania flava]ASP29872.1 hypothetical protein CHH26_06240 [Qipengyuania flava]